MTQDNILEADETLIKKPNQLMVESDQVLENQDRLKYEIIKIRHFTTNNFEINFDIASL